MDSCKELSLSRARLIGLLSVILFLIAIINFGYYFVYMPFTIHGVDFTVLWRAARQFALGEPTYQPPTILIGSDGWEVFKYPQFLACMASWLALCSLEAGEAMWKLFMLICVVLMGALSLSSTVLTAPDSAKVRGCGNPLRWLEMSGVLTALSFFSPLSWSLELGQVGPLLALLLLGAHLALLRGKTSLGIFWITVAGLIKLSPLFLLLPFAMRRHWWALRLAGALLVGYVIVLGVFGRWSDELYYLRHVAPEIPALTHFVSHSLFQVLTKILHIDPLEAPVAYRSSLAIFQMIALSFYVGILAILRRHGCSLEQLWLVSLTGLVVILPVLEGHHFVVLWPVFLEFYRQAWAQKLPTFLISLNVFTWLPIFLAGPLHKLSTWEPIRFLPASAALVLWTLTILTACRFPPEEGA